MTKTIRFLPLTMKPISKPAKKVNKDMKSQMAFEKTRARLVLNGREVSLEQIAVDCFLVRASHPPFEAKLPKAAATVKFEELAKELFSHPFIEVTIK